MSAQYAGASVKSYRIYIVGSGGRLQLGETFNERDDAEAAAYACGAIPRGQVAELWEAGRLVGRIDKDGQFVRGVG